MDNISSGIILMPKITSPFKLLQNALANYKKRFVKFIGMYVMGLLGLVPLVVVVVLYFVLTYALSENLLLQVINIILGVLGIASVCFAVYFFVRSYIGLILFLEKPIETPVREVFASTKVFFWRFFGTSLLSSLFILLWLLLLIIPGIVFAIYYSFAIFVLLYEGLAFTKALKRSKGLIKGYWWAVFGRLLFLIVAYYILVIVLSIPSTLMPQGSWGQMLWSLMISVFNWLIGPLFMLYSYLMYKDLVVIKGQPPTV